MIVQFSSVQFHCLVVSNSATPWTAAHQASLSITNSWSLLKLMSITLAFSSCLQSIPALVFSNESIRHIRWPKYWSFSFGISLSNEYSGLTSFRIDWLDLLAVQGTLKSLPQHDSSKASILWCSAFFIVQLSHPYMTTGKTIALTGWAFVGKVMSLAEAISTSPTHISAVIESDSIRRWGSQALKENCLISVSRIALGSFCILIIRCLQSIYHTLLLASTKSYILKKLIVFIYVIRSPLIL